VTVGTVIWSLPGAHAHVTSPGRALLFPSFCAHQRGGDTRRRRQANLYFADM
jgi:hypothetical protein